jgi:hypothetical protein
MEVTAERRFGSTTARNALFIEMSQFASGQHGPLLLGSFSDRVLGIHYRDLSPYDRTVLTNTLLRLGWEKRRKHWCRIEPRPAA